MLGGIIRGKRTTLRTPVEADLPSFNSWMADMRVRRGGHLWDEPAWIDTWKERLKEAAKEENSVLWTIEADGSAVGVIRNHLWQETPVGVSMSLFVIDPDHWRQGLGMDAAVALHRYVFDYLDRKLTDVELPADNAGGLRIAEKLGYREFGRGHEVYYRDGKYVDRLHLRYDRAVWDERFGKTEREYAPFPEGIAS